MKDDLTWVYNLRANEEREGVGGGARVRQLERERQGEKEMEGGVREERVREK